MKVKNIDHMSFTVADMERSLAFYQRLGFEPDKRYISTGPDAAEGTDTPEADIDVGWLRHPEGGPMLELLRYQNKAAGRSVHNSEVGAAHICLNVEDVEAAYADLKCGGVPFVSAPHSDQYGVTWVYMRDPDGNVVELLQQAQQSHAGNLRRSATWKSG
jgi:catechol 2,3-dioxygenase-like lactoylglutathione lyase family enzyme